MLPEGEDPDSLIRNKGAAAFEKTLAGARDFFDHTITRVAERQEGGILGPRERATLARHLGGYIALLPGAALKETTANHVAIRLGLSVEALAEAMKNPTSMPGVEGISVDAELNAESEAPSKVSPSTELLCRLALLSGEVRDWVSGIKESSGEALEELDPELALLDRILPPLSGLESPTPSTLLALLPGPLQSLVSSWDLEKIPEKPLETAKDILRGLRLRKLKRRQSEIARELRQSGLTQERIVLIQKEILDLQRNIHDVSPPAS
jgi:DNA primase